MGQLVFQATLGGQVNLVGPNTASTFNINVPATTGTMVTTGDSGTVTSTMLASSLSFTTPNLGTPSAGVLTNCTSLPAASLTGVISQTNGGTGTTTGYYGFKNRIINGAMMIDQRNAGTEVNPAVNSTYYLDRWSASLAVASKFKIGRNAGAVTPPAGYINYLGCTSLSAYSVVAADIFNVQQKIEGLNIADLAWGTASAATVTLSFLVYSSLTGTFGGSLRNSVQDRSYPFSYSISSANTWTTISITIAGDTSGTWLTTNGIGIQIVFSLGTGTTLSGTAGAWAAANYASATGAVSVVGTSGATFYITGVQLEKGSVATSFDYRPYGTQLALCQRYYYRISPNAVDSIFGMCFMTSTTVSLAVIKYTTTMRIAPTALEQSGTANQYAINNSATNTSCSSVPTYSARTTAESGVVLFTVASGLTAGQGGTVKTDITNGATSYLGWSAEL